MNSENKKPVYDLWVILTAFGAFNAVLFYYAGIKSKSGKYIKVGHFYLFLIFLSFFINLNVPFIKNIISYLYLGGYIFGLVFALKTLPAYRRRLALLKHIDYISLENKNIYSIDNQTLENLIKNNPAAVLENDTKTSVFSNSNSLDTDIFTENNEDEYPRYIGQKTKINTDPEEKLYVLPFITKELVRKIILERKLGNGFRNENDLRSKLGLSDRNARILAQRIDFSFENKQL